MRIVKLSSQQAVISLNMYQILFYKKRSPQDYQSDVGCLNLFLNSSWLLDHVIYLKLRRKKLLSNLSKFTK